MLQTGTNEVSADRRQEWAESCRKGLNRAQPAYYGICGLVLRRRDWIGLCTVLELVSFGIQRVRHMIEVDPCLIVMHVFRNPAGLRRSGTIIGRTIGRHVGAPATCHDQRFSLVGSIDRASRSN